MASFAFYQTSFYEVGRRSQGQLWAIAFLKGRKEEGDQGKSQPSRVQLDFIFRGSQHVPESTGKLASLMSNTSWVLEQAEGGRTVCEAQDETRNLHDSPANITNKQWKVRGKASDRVCNHGVLNILISEVSSRFWGEGEHGRDMQLCSSWFS